MGRQQGQHMALLAWRRDHGVVGGLSHLSQLRGVCHWAGWACGSGGPAWLPWWLSISSKLTSNYMVNGITVKSSSLSSPGLNAPLGQRHLMALRAGSGFWKSAFGSHWPEVIFALPVLQPTCGSIQNGIGQENASVRSVLLGPAGLSLAGVA